MSADLAIFLTWFGSGFLALGLFHLVDYFDRRNDKRPKTFNCPSPKIIALNSLFVIFGCVALGGLSIVIGTYLLSQLLESDMVCNWWNNPICGKKK